MTDAEPGRRADDGTGERVSERSQRTEDDGGGDDKKRDRQRSERRDDVRAEHPERSHRRAAHPGSGVREGVAVEVAP